MTLNDLVLPSIGDIWCDANDCHNLVLAFDDDKGTVTILTLETGHKWFQERLIDWNDPEECTARDADLNRELCEQMGGNIFTPAGG